MIQFIIGPLSKLIFVSMKNHLIGHQKLIFNKCCINFVNLNKSMIQFIIGPLSK